MLNSNLNVQYSKVDERRAKIKIQCHLGPILDIIQMLKLNIFHFFFFTVIFQCIV